MFKSIFLKLGIVISIIAIFFICPIFVYANENTAYTYYSESLKIEYDIVSSWDNNQHINIVLTNIGETDVENWKLYYDFNGIIYSIWNGSIETNENGNQFISCKDYNSVIKPNTSITLGYLMSNIRGIPNQISLFPINDEPVIYYKEILSDDNICYDNDGAPYYRNQIIVTAAESASFDEIKKIATEISAYIVGYIEITNEFQFEFLYDVSIDDISNIIADIEKNPLVDTASINSIFTLSESEYNIPNDIEINLQNGLNTYNWNLYAIKAIDAWKYIGKMTPVNIGVIDNIFFKHDDISYIKNYNQTKIADDNHGTSVAGIMAAQYNNAQGIAGICPVNNLYTYSTHKRTSIYEYQAALSKLIQNDIKVINVSLNAFGYDEPKEKEKLNNNDKKTLKKYNNNTDKICNTLQRYISKGYDFVIVVAAGNDGVKGYDARYANYLSNIDTEIKNNIIVVGGLTYQDEDSELFEKDITELIFEFAEYSNIGNRIDVVAPSTNILSLDYSENYNSGKLEQKSIYRSLDGTSYAAPHVSGIAGMMYSVNPNISGFEVKEIIKTTSQLRKVADNHGYEYGIADAKLAVSTAYYCNPDNADKIIFGKLKDFNDTSKVYSNTDLKVSYSYNGFTTTSIISSDENGEFELVIPKDVDINSLVIHIDGYGVTNTNILGVFFGGSIVIDTFITPIEASIYGTVTVKNVTTGEEKPQANYIFRILKDGEEYMTATTQADGTYKAQVTEYGLYTVIFDEEHQYEVYIGENMNYEANCELECDDEEDDTKLSGTGANLYCIITYEDNCNLCHYIDCEYIQIEKIEDEWPVILLENVVYNHTYGSVGLKEEGHYEDNPVDWRLDTMRWAINKDYYYDIKTIEIHLTGTIYDSEENLCSDSIVFSKGNSVESHAVFL